MEDRNEEKKNGRPTLYRESYCEQARKLCLLNKGTTDKTLADFFEVDVSTISNWKLVHPNFLEAIKIGKQMSDLEVVNSLYNNTQDRIIPKKKQVKLKRVEYDERGRKIKEEEYMQEIEEEDFVRADIRAIQMWLPNRQRDQWSNSSNVDITTDGEKLNTATSIVFTSGMGTPVDEDED